jgi:hypothetical protein
MKNYQGVNANDVPVGAGWFVNQNNDGGEVYNFYPLRGFYYGFARIQMGRNLNIKRLGALPGQSALGDVTVIFFGRNPQTGGQYIIGWYLQAILYQSLQQPNNLQRGNHPYFITKTEIHNGHLIPEEDRIFEVPNDGPGQTNAWYVEEFNNRYLSRVERYIQDPVKYIKEQPRETKNRNRWQRDVELRKQIEFSAMDAVADYFSARRYIVDYVHRENLGWDLEASIGRKKLFLEVKGLSEEFIAVIFTPNEFRQSTRYRSNYRICIVSNALSEARKVEIFYWKNDCWISNDNKVLNVEPIEYARFYMA